MDPDANAARQLELAREIIELEDTLSRETDEAENDPAGIDYARIDEHAADVREDIAGRASELAQLVIDLAKWRDMGGFPPGVLDESPLPDPPEHLRDAWERYQAGGKVAGWELSKLDEWRDDCARADGY